MTAKNSQIGTVVCPFKGCAHVCKVYKFQQRTDGRRSMFTGKMYADCPDHGRIGADGRQASQDYILEGEIWGAKKPESAPAAEPEKPQEKPAIPASGQQQSKPANPASTPAPMPAQQPQQPAQKAGWGFM